MTVMRPLLRTLPIVLVALAAVGATLTGYAAGQAAPAHTTATPDGICGGLPRACQQGLDYWQNIPTRHITISVDPTLEEQNHSGYANWDATTCRVRINPRFLGRWQVYAHEFGHCHGLSHDEHGDVDRPGYKGIMDYDQMWRGMRVDHDHAWEAEQR